MPSRIGQFLCWIFLVFMSLTHMGLMPIEFHLYLPFIVIVSTHVLATTIIVHLLSLRVLNSRAGQPVAPLP